MRSERDAAALCVAARGTVHVALQEGDEVRSCLADYEMVDVKQFCDASEWAFALGVACVRPGTESRGLGGEPGDDFSVWCL